MFSFEQKHTHNAPEQEVCALRQDDAASAEVPICGGAEGPTPPAEKEREKPAFGLRGSHTWLERTHEHSFPVVLPRQTVIKPSRQNRLWAAQEP